MFERSQQRADLVMFLERVTEAVVAIDEIAVAPAFADSGDVAAGFEIVDDLECRAFGDTDEFGDVANAEVGRAGHSEQDVSVIRQEGPRPACCGVSHNFMVVRFTE